MDFEDVYYSVISLVGWYGILGVFAFIYLITNGHGIIMFVIAALYGFLMNRSFSNRTVIYSGAMLSIISGATYAFLSFPHIECGRDCLVSPPEFARDFTPWLGLHALVLGVLGVNAGIHIHQKWSTNRITLKFWGKRPF